MSILTLSNTELNSLVSDYYDDLVALAQQALAGEITAAFYRQEQERLTEAAMMAAVLLSGADAANGELTAVLEQQLAQARDSAGKLAGDVGNGRYVDNEESLRERLTLWTFSLGYLFDRAQLYAGDDDDPMTWRLGKTEQHCVTCLSQAGQTRTRAEWRELANQGISPRSGALACGGWRCDCEVG